MLSQLDEQAFVAQIQDQEQNKEIENLLRNRKKLARGLVRDPVYNQLYVDWEQPKRRIKTEVNLSSHLSRSRIRARKDQQATAQQKKHHSQSVQLPKISKRLTPRPLGNGPLEIRHSGPRQDKSSEYAVCRPSKPSILNPRSLRKQGVVPQVIWSSYQTHYNTINSEEEEQKPQPNSNPKQSNPYQQILSKKFKLNNATQKTKKKKTINKDWLQTDILSLQTYFVKLKKNRHQEPIDKVHMQDPEDSVNPITDRMGLPAREKIPEFIRNYKPINPLVEVDNLIKRPDFKIIYDEGQSLYFGEALEGNQTRVGILATKNMRFQGIWKKGLKSQGYEITSHGYYKGHFKQGKRHGEGEFQWKNGEMYSGEWFKGVKHGSGMWKSGKGDTYIGEWKQGKVQGLGVHTSANGQRYQGEFVSFLKEGRGKELFPNGDTYEGDYNRGKPHGKGKYIWKNGISYQGSFIEGYRQGSGTITAKNYVHFSGHFDKELATGQGSLKFDNGDEYQGQFSKGLKHGKGTMRLRRQKKVLSGEWVNGQFNFDVDF